MSHCQVPQNWLTVLAVAACQSEHYAEACESADLGEFKGIPLLPTD